MVKDQTMSPWQAFKEGLKSAGFYRRQALFFGILILVGLGGVWLWNNYKPSASADVSDFSGLGGNVLNYHLEILPSGRLQKNGVVLKERIIPRGDFDELRFQVVDDSDIYYDAAQITVSLPGKVNLNTAKKPSIIAVHGVSSSSARFLDNQTLYFEALDIFPKATVTIVAQIPKGVIKLGVGGQFERFLGGLSGYIWLALGSLIALFGFAVFFRMISNQNRFHNLLASGHYSTKPPGQLSPAMVGVLIEGGVTPNVLAATLFDLAAKGYLKIFERDGQYAFIQAKSLNPLNWKGLHPYERDLLSKIFYMGDPISSLEDIKKRLGEDLFSRKIGEFYGHVYQEATQLGFFLENPSKVHHRYRLMGIVTFYLGLMGFVYGILTLDDPKFALFIWAGVALVGLMVATLSKKVSLRSRAGRLEAAKWLGFAKYLKKPWRASVKDATEDTYFKYLPYAVALGAADRWTLHFKNQPFAQPVWYDSDNGIADINQFALSFLPFMAFLGKQFDFAHEPTVD